MATSFSFYITAVYEEDSKYSLFLLDVLLVYQFPIMLPKRRFGRDKMSNSIENYLVMVDSDAICKCVIVYFYWLAGLCVMSKWVWYKYEKETQSDSDVEIKLFIYLAPLLITNYSYREVSIYRSNDHFLLYSHSDPCHVPYRLWNLWIDVFIWISTIPN